MELALFLPQTSRRHWTQRLVFLVSVPTTRGSWALGNPLRHKRVCPGGFILSSQPMQTPLNMNSRIAREMWRDFTFSGGRKEHGAIWAISGIVHRPEYLPLGISLTRWSHPKRRTEGAGTNTGVKEQVNCTSPLDGSHASEAEGAEGG